MTWAKIDDNFADHPKVVGLSLAAVGLWTLCLSYARRRNSPELPKGIVNRYAGKRMALISELVASGLWEESGNGWSIHNFADYGPPLDLSAKRAEAGRMGGLAKAFAKQLPENTPAENSKGFPLPEPEPESDVSNSSLELFSPIEEVWNAWKESTGKPKSILDTKRRKIIREALRITDLDSCIDAVRGWVNDPWVRRSDFNDVKYLLKDAKAIEDFAGYHRNGPPKSEEELRKEKRMRELLGTRQ